MIMKIKKAGALSLSLLLGLSGCASGTQSESNEKTLTVGTSQEMSGVFSPLYYLSGFDGDKNADKVRVIEDYVSTINRN